MAPILLALVAVLLAWPVPVLLGRAQWPARAPVAAMILWQAVGLGGGLALISAPLLYAVRKFGSGLIPAGTEIFEAIANHGLFALHLDPRWGGLEIVAGTLAVAIGVHLVLSLVYSAWRTTLERRRHRETVQLLSKVIHDPTASETLTPYQRNSGGVTTLLLPSEHPLAYCIPALSGSYTVISQGLMERLTEAELSAVIEHEKAHLRQRHDLLRVGFEAWHRAASWLVATETSRIAVTTLTEMLADDAALARIDRATLIRSMAVVASHDSPHTIAKPLSSDQPADRTTSVTAVRLKRLLSSRPPLPGWQQALIITLAACLLIVPAALTLCGV
ncbi:M56 family metallopeptidase [Auritidibacter ignavus]|uniref:M56 family metallopeptidase n=1 Tax=Auritidibacter ignavus TaxID=678932 RepID=A0AAJ6DDK4_9MICC|nr:M56 family metallopeptidase [Auritidibacter ignavus]WGH91511.1 M56 family metallopeptidase [Auritidibacter ignavus]WGH93942.1 M56 family metallopeptidase [Auritidibacter ignavus]WHS34687.1 M56 family metallopeptidase [Auritidibacter ignavus]